jgi:ABC-2 type transport system permease protein
MPVRDSEVVVGKFVAAAVLLTAGLALTLAYPITVSRLGALDWGPVISGYLGMLLFAGSLLAVGLMCSTLTDNQIVAFIVAFLVSATLYYIYWLQFFVPPFLAPLVDYVSVSSHLANMARGVVDSRDVLFYVSLIIGGLLLAVRALARRHA